MTHNRAVTKLGTEPPTVAEALLSVVRDPAGCLIQRWNWKAALTSSLFRASLFFFVNLTAGPKAAVGALLTELVLRSVTSGFYGSLTEALREAQPGWLAGLTAALLMPLANHSVELLVHWLRGTPKLTNSILASVCFTMVSTLFTLYVMRRGALIVGEDQQSLAMTCAACHVWWPDSLRPVRSPSSVGARAREREGWLQRETLERWRSGPILDGRTRVVDSFWLGDSG